MNANINKQLRRLVREAFDSSHDGMGDPSLTINNLEQFNDLIYSLETFADQFEHPLWDALGATIMDAISNTPEYMALEKAIEPSF